MGRIKGGTLSLEPAISKRIIASRSPEPGATEHPLTNHARRASRFGFTGGNFSGAPPLINGKYVDLLTGAIMVSVHIIGGEGRGYSGIETGIEPYCTVIVAALIYDRGLIKCCWAGRRWNRIRSAEAPLVPSAGFDRSVTTNLSALSASKASHAISSI